ncbi:hypothetical protein JOL79_20600 [Microbispora sp. RL4-1S]|uniref:Uncharacterized protein n=1 Tax=Microbispora oryzae TaxID=2806554 RepID=A0A941ALF5_9ACTN|nr:hypothetical protein [Microbispora oryzae]MBP2706213.1 hypothetical protein [Microbispora oryzae]
MDIRRPSTDEVFGHYQRLVGEPELDVAACWAVVVPHDSLDSLSLPEVSTRLGGGTSYALREVVKPHFVNLPLRRQGPCTVVDRSGAAVVLYGLDHLGYSSGALRRLSSNARVYSAWWNVNSVNRLSLTVNGEVLVSINGLFPGRPEDHPNLASWPELTAMSEFFLDYVDEDFLGRDDRWDWRAGFLTAIELATGVRLDRQWLDVEHPYLVFSGPIPE